MFLAPLHVLSRVVVVESSVVPFLILVNCVPEMLKLVLSPEDFVILFLLVSSLVVVAVGQVS